MEKQQKQPNVNKSADFLTKIKTGSLGPGPGPSGNGAKIMPALLVNGDSHSQANYPGNKKSANFANKMHQGQSDLLLQRQNASQTRTSVGNDPFENSFYRQASFFLPVSGSSTNSAPFSKTGAFNRAIESGWSKQGDERKATTGAFSSSRPSDPSKTVWAPNSDVIEQRNKQLSASIAGKLMKQLLVYDNRTSKHQAESSLIPPTLGKGVHVSQAICKVKDPGGFDCYGFLFALPIPPVGSLRYGLMTLSSFNMGQRTKRSLNLLIHFEASYRPEKPLEIPFTRWITCKKMGVTFFQLPDEAAQYVQYKRLDFLEAYRGKLAERQKVMALQNRNGAKQPQCVVGEISQIGLDGYFKHKISSLSGLPILDPLTFTVIGIQKGADFSGNELAVTMKSVIAEMAPNKQEHWTEADHDKSEPPAISRDSSSLACENLSKDSNSSDDINSSSSSLSTAPRSLSSRIRMTKQEQNLVLIRNSKLVPDSMKEEICDVVQRYYLTADELALKNESDIRLLFPRRELQETVFAWKRSIQIDCWRREKLPIEGERLHQAIKAGDLGLVKGILFHKTIPPGCRPLLVEARCARNYNNTPLLLAALHGNVPIVQFLVRECNANVYAKDGHELESLPIHLAAAHGHFDVVSILLDYRHDLLEAKNKINDTPLNRAAARGRILITQYLVDKKFANIENRGEFGRTPLMMAAAWGHLPVVEFLRERGADVYVKDTETCSTAIHLAAFFGQANVVAYLIDRHPDLTTVKNKFGKTAWARAKSEQKKNVLNVLQNRNRSDE